MWIRTDGDSDVVTLAAPPADVSVRGLVVAADGEQVSAPDPVPGEPVRVALDSAPTTVYLDYDLVGAVDRTGTVPGRALASPTFLVADVPGVRGPVRVRLTGQRLLNVSCAARTAPTAPRPCGRQQGRAWRVELPVADRDDEVSAQLDLVTE